MKVQSQIKPLLLVFCVLAACGKAKEEDDKNNPLSPNSKTEIRNTVLTSCEGELTDRGSIVRNPWIDLRTTSKNLSIKDTFVFKSDKLTKRTVCSYDKKSVEVIVEADIALSQTINEFSIIKGAKNTEHITIGNKEYPCTAEILKTEDPVKFQFAGDCLHLIPNAESAISYPAGFW